MTESKCRITIEPDQVELEGVRGDSLYTLLMVEGLLQPGDPLCGRFCLERGQISPPEHPEAEAEIFTPAQRAEGWLLAAERRLAGDAVLSRLLPAKEEPPVRPLASGLALVFDIGSATIAAGLVDLKDMRIPLLTACPNSQMVVDSDLSRRRQWAAAQENGQERLRSMILEDMQRLTDKLITRSGASGDQVQAVAVAGHHMMLEHLARFARPAYGQVRCFDAALLGLQGLAQGARVYLLPSAASDVGPDVVSACLAADLLRKKERERLTFLVDLGMSGQVVASGQGRMMAASVASLPFEGNGIGCGMPAMTGAVIRVEIGQQVTIKTVRDARPQGMTGAGLLSAVRALREQGLLDDTGRLLPPDNQPPAVARHFRVGAAGREFVVSFADHNLNRDISISQDDILQLQMAKGAIHAACAALLHAMNATAADVDSVLLAESYRAHLNPDDVLALDMTPAVSPNQIAAIGNAAWQGAFLALCDRKDLEQTEQIASTLERLDLTTDLVYAREFLQGMEFAPKREISPKKFIFSIDK